MKFTASVIAVVGLIGCIKGTHSGGPEKPEAGPTGVTTISVADVSVPPATAQAPVRCPSGMVEVTGEYCPNVEQVCLSWVDALGAATDAPEPGKTGRCGVWKFPSKCLSPKVHKSFCMDRFEYPNIEGERPQSWMTWYDVKRACESQGKRMCTRSEWTFACEGPEMKPYPYGDGYHRDRTSCNIDNPTPDGVDVFKSKAPHDAMSLRLDEMLVPAGSKPACVSSFGVYDMVGNIDEQIVNETGCPYISGLMSGHVFGVRNACRPMTEAHGPDFGWYETGGRCCGETR